MASGSQETAPAPAAVYITLNPRSTHRTEKLCSSGMFVDLVLWLQSEHLLR